MTSRGTVPGDLRWVRCGLDVGDVELGVDDAGVIVAAPALARAWRGKGEELLLRHLARVSAGEERAAALPG